VKVHIERDWMSRSLRVWFYESARENGATLIKVKGSDALERVEVPAGVHPEPSLVLPEDFVEALIREASDVLPPSDATSAHLSDARSTRDRLLAMIEKRGLR
jgi:hypothetical protein